jgi:hypothetical protein
VTNDKNVILEFTIANNSKLNNLDAFLITAVKDDQEYPVTAVNASKYSIRIIDATNLNFIGRIKYYLRTLTVSGVMSSKKHIRTIDIIDHEGIQ